MDSGIVEKCRNKDKIFASIYQLINLQKFTRELESLLDNLPDNLTGARAHLENNLDEAYATQHSVELFLNNIPLLDDNEVLQ